MNNITTFKERLTKRFRKLTTIRHGDLVALFSTEEYENKRKNLQDNHQFPSIYFPTLSIKCRFLFGTLSNVSNSAGNSSRLANKEAINVMEISNPIYLVPSKLEAINVLKPKNRISEV